MSGKILKITNFKSIKNLEINCGRINVFIGEPNTGKSNILEALGLMSFFMFGNQRDIQDFVRNERISNLFYDEIIEIPVEIIYESLRTEITFSKSQLQGQLRPNTESFNWQASIQGDYSNIISQGKPDNWRDFPIKYYKFVDQIDYTQDSVDFLLPSKGRNLVSLILTNKKIKKFIDETLRTYGLRIVIKPQENKIEIIKLLEDILISYPYSLLSDTLKRIVFHMAAILSNNNSVLVFEEPESHAFPYHTKYLAEKIALDNTNKYFIATHNPYEGIAKRTIYRKRKESLNSSG
jgi:AAA15 family ATPase/GTPase